MAARRSIALAVGLSFALLVGACGDDDDADDGADPAAEGGGGSGGEPVSDDADAYVAAIVASADEAELEVIGAERSECIARAFVSGVGVETLNERGLSPDEVAAADFSPEQEGIELDDAQRAQLETDFAACGNAVDLLLDFSETASEITPEQQECLRGAVTEEQAVAFFVDGLLGRSPAAEFQTAIQGCLQPA